MKNVLHFPWCIAIHLPYVERVNSGQGQFSENLTEWHSIILTPYIYATLTLDRFWESSKYIFDLAFFQREKITKNSHLITQTLIHMHQTSSSIIHDHLGAIYAWVFFNTLCLVSYSVISYIYCVFLNKQSHLSLVFH